MSVLGPRLGRAGGLDGQRVAHGEEERMAKRERWKSEGVQVWRFGLWVGIFLEAAPWPAAHVAIRKVPYLTYT